MSRPKSKLTIDQMRKMREDGMTYQAIADIAGIRQVVVWNRLNPDRIREYCRTPAYREYDREYHRTPSWREYHRKYWQEYHSQKKFGGIREFVILRDGERCVDCKMTRSEHRERYGCDITVDHVDLNGSGKPPELKNNDPTNLQTMCLSCHNKKDWRLRKELKSNATN